MSNVFVLIIFALMALMGGGSTIYVVLALPATIIYKIFRKVKYGEKMI